MISKNRSARIRCAALLITLAAPLCIGCGTGRRLHAARQILSEKTTTAGQILSDKANLFAGETFGTEHIQIIVHQPTQAVERTIEELFSGKGYSVTKTGSGFVIRRPREGTRCGFIQVMDWDGSKELKVYPFNTLVDAIYMSQRSEDQMEEKRLPIPFWIRSRLKLLEGGS